MIRLKTEKDIDGIRKSCHLLARLFDVLEPAIVPGGNTLQLDGIARDFIVSNGGTPSFLGYQDYPASICASVNEQVIHGIPNATPLKEGDILSLDIGITLDGYYSDRAFTYPVGTISEDMQRLVDVTRNSLSAAIDSVKAGVRVRDISRAVQDTVLPHNYGIVHEFCGHGVGFELHEEPQIPNYVGRGANPRIKAGMVFAIEPMINMGTGEIEILDDQWTVVTADRAASAHFEHTVAVFADHMEILTELQ